MNRITKISGAVAAVMMFSVGGAFAAETKCGVLPQVPDLPADGTALASKEMDTLADAFDTYQNKFAEFNKCAVEEFNSTQMKFEALIDAYASKGKKK
jgi:hypothetical protein